MKKLLWALLLLGIGMAAGLMWRSGEGDIKAIKIDTVRICAPAAIDSFPIKIVTAKAAVAKRANAEARKDIVDYAAISPPGKDSVEVELPIVSKEYGDSAYRAWVSGYMPRLDSIHIYARAPPSPDAARPKRWHLGVTVGYAATPQGLRPYAGVGLTYSFISF